ncbi:hypothetical protein B0T09DRAFT_111795 [Sordaria sp. MPI-SDFR-AT-0083]|nr:hypothetical protein B0T09DRAFT_111795 [Sordaria sp. MPI-SDFR-AT-0083]
MANNLSPPGSSSYSSNTLTVGDGTWDFEKNSFLLPNLQGLNFDTMRYNGMGNRFSTLTQYHSLILGHGVIAAITFLFIIPIAVLIARFYSRKPGYAIRYHAYLQVITVGLSTVVFVLGFIAVGPPRNLTNPHHGIGVAIYVMILVQAFGGSLIRKITGHSFRLHLHRWMGRAIAILGIAQVPLGLTLYGSPKYTFILYAVWMGFLLFLYFILDYRDKERREYYAGGARSEVTGYTDEKSESHHHGKKKWLGLAAAGGALAMLRGRKRNKDEERALDRSPSPYRSHAPHDGATEVSHAHGRHDSYHDDKYTDVSSRRDTGGGGWMGKLAGLGAGLLAAKYLKNKHDRRDDEYSAVSTETPSRVRPPRGGPAPTESDYTDYTDFTRTDNRRNSKQNPVIASEVESAADDRRPYRPGTPPRSHAGRRNSRFESTIASDYSSYVSPSRREEPEKKRNSGAGKGLLAGLGLGWFAKKTVDKRAGQEEDRIRDDEERRREEEERRHEEEERRAGRRNSKYTGDGYPSPSRRDSQRRPAAMRPAAPTDITSTTGSSIFSDEFTSMEPRGHAPYDPAPMAGGARPPPAPIPVAGGAPGVGAPPTIIPITPGPSGNPPPGNGPIAMPAMPPDPRGVFYPLRPPTDTSSSDLTDVNADRRRREAEAAAAAAAASASLLAAQQQEDDRRRRPGGPSDQPSVKVKVQSDRDRNITLRRMTDEDARKDGGNNRRRRGDSVSSSHSESEPSSGRRYRRSDRRESRSSSQRGRAERAAEARVDPTANPLYPAPLNTGGSGTPRQQASHGGSSLPPNFDDPLSPPNPAFARQGTRPISGKDSPPFAGPSGGQMPNAAGTISSLDSPAQWSALSPSGASQNPSGVKREVSSAAERRQRRRFERREGSRQRAAAESSLGG